MKVRYELISLGEEEGIYISFVHRHTQATIRVMIYDVRGFNVMVYKHHEFRCDDPRSSIGYDVHGWISYGVLISYMVSHLTQCTVIRMLNWLSSLI